jgi:hypothetical protein
MPHRGFHDAKNGSFPPIDSAPALTVINGPLMPDPQNPIFPISANFRELHLRFLGLGNGAQTSPEQLNEKTTK